MKSDFSPEFKSLPGFIHLNTPPQNPQYKLPSLGEFDQGVEDLARVHGRTSPMIGRTVFNDWGNTTTNQALPSVWAVREHVAEEHVPNAYLPRRETNSLGQYTLAIDQARRPLQSYTSPDSSYNYPMTSPTVLAQSNMDCYPSPPPEGENRHINQKYTTEEGDYIIYAWHDKKMKWQRIKQEFATRFGCTPERTVQGLQAWYYRMNQRIPIWDQDGWLCYDNEDDVEPRHVSIKCRARDSQDKPMEPLGLAQRYPERAMNYSWVDPELKEKARDWGESDLTC